MFLKVENLSKTYSTKTFLTTKKFDALRNISFSLNEGESCSIIGASGSGKTTLGKILARILPFTGGSIKYCNKDIKKYSLTDFSNMAQMIFQNPYASLNPKLKIKTSLMEVFKNQKNKNNYEKIKDVLNSVDLNETVLNNYPHQFSGGQRQRIAIARVLLKNPKLIIADEPFTSLDVYCQKQIMEIFDNIKRKFHTSILLITHDISAAKKFSKRMIIMQNGSIVANDDFENILHTNDNEYIEDLISSMEL